MEGIREVFKGATLDAVHVLASIFICTRETLTNTNNTNCLNSTSASHELVCVGRGAGRTSEQVFETLVTMQLIGGNVTSGWTLIEPESVSAWIKSHEVFASVRQELEIYSEREFERLLGVSQEAMTLEKEFSDSEKWIWKQGLILRATSLDADRARHAVANHFFSSEWWVHVSPQDTVIVAKGILDAKETVLPEYLWRQLQMVLTWRALLPPVLSSAVAKNLLPDHSNLAQMIADVSECVEPSKSSITSFGVAMILTCGWWWGGDTHTPAIASDVTGGGDVVVFSHRSIYVGREPIKFNHVLALRENIVEWRKWSGSLYLGVGPGSYKSRVIVDLTDFEKARWSLQAGATKYDNMKTVVKLENGRVGVILLRWKPGVGINLVLAEYQELDLVREVAVTLVKRSRLSASDASITFSEFPVLWSESSSLVTCETASLRFSDVVAHVHPILGLGETSTEVLDDQLASLTNLNIRGNVGESLRWVQMGWGQDCALVDVSKGLYQLLVHLTETIWTEKLTSPNNGRSPEELLTTACAENIDLAVQFLLRTCADRLQWDELSSVLLPLVSENGAVHIAELILETVGMERLQRLDGLDENGSSSLYIALEWREWDMARWLIHVAKTRHLTEFDASGQSILTAFCRLDRLDVVKFLLEETALSPMSADGQGYSALDVVALAPDVSTELLKYVKEKANMETSAE